MKHRGFESSDLKDVSRETFDTRRTNWHLKSGRPRNLVAMPMDGTNRAMRNSSLQNSDVFEKYSASKKSRPQNVGGMFDENMCETVTVTG